MSNDDRALRTEGGIAYETRGEGEPILFIHGSWIEDAFDPVLREPALGEYRLIRYDRRAYGDSDGHSAAFTISGEAADAADVLHHLGVDSAHVVGHSYGGVIGFELARSHPELVRSLVLIEPPLPLVTDPPPPPPAFVVEAVERYQAGDREGAADRFMRGISSPSWREDLEAAIPGAVVQVARQITHFFERELPALGSYPVERSAVTGLEPPVVYILGTVGSDLHDRNVEVLERWHPEIDVLRVQGADHTLPIQWSAEVARAIARFVQN